jgi:hypothetical protein
MSKPAVRIDSTKANREDADYADETFERLYLEPTTPEDRRGAWRAFQAQEGGKPFELYDSAVVELLYHRRKYSIELLQRGSGEPWTPPAAPVARGA